MWKILPGAAAAGEHLHLLGDPRAGGVDEVDHRHPQAQRALLDADDLLDRLRAPRARPSPSGRWPSPPPAARRCGPRPVTTPSAPRPSPSQLASSASSANEPSSSSRATRSRTGSLPCSRALSWWRSGPPARARSSASLQVAHCSLLISKTWASPREGAGGSGRLGRRPMASSPPAPTASTSGQPSSVALPPAAATVVASRTATPIHPGPGRAIDGRERAQPEAARVEEELPAGARAGAEERRGAEDLVHDRGSAPAPARSARPRRRRRPRAPDGGRGWRRWRPRGRRRARAAASGRSARRRARRRGRRSPGRRGRG